MTDYSGPNAMEELVKAALTVSDLAGGYQGRVELDESYYDDLQDLLKEIYDGQIALAEHGWTRDKKAAELMPYQKHNVECGAWFKNKADGSGTDWMRCTITTRFGLRAVFWNTVDPGEHQLKEE